MFKDGHKFIDALSHFFPKAIRKELRQTVKELNETLSAYISSTILDALIIGVMSFLAMRIFNQPYSYCLRSFAASRILSHMSALLLEQYQQSLSVCLSLHFKLCTWRCRF